MCIEKRADNHNWEDEDEWRLHRISESDNGGGIPRYHLTAEQYQKWHQPIIVASWTFTEDDIVEIDPFDWVTLSCPEVFPHVQYILTTNDDSKLKNWEDQDQWDLYRTDNGIRRYRLTPEQAQKWLNGENQ
jgi:hypothetical protein